MQPLILENSVVAGAVVTVLKTPPVPDGFVFTALSIMALDEDTAIATYIEIGIVHGTKLIKLDSTPGPFPANTSLTIYWPCMLCPGQQVYARFVTPTAGDHLHLAAHGAVDCLECEL